MARRAFSFHAGITLDGTNAWISEPSLDDRTSISGPFSVGHTAMITSDPATDFCIEATLLKIWNNE
jgi:ribosomal protein S8E